MLKPGHHHVFALGAALLVGSIGACFYGVNHGPAPVFAALGAALMAWTLYPILNRPRS